MPVAQEVTDDVMLPLAVGVLEAKGEGVGDADAVPDPVGEFELLELPVGALIDTEDRKLFVEIAVDEPLTEAGAVADTVASSVTRGENVEPIEAPDLRAEAVATSEGAADTVDCVDILGVAEREAMLEGLAEPEGELNFVTALELVADTLPRLDSLELADTLTLAVSDTDGLFELVIEGD